MDLLKKFLDLVELQFIILKRTVTTYECRYGSRNSR